MHSHHCSYLSPGAKAPDHQYSQCWLNSRCTETVSYKNITLMVNNIRKYSGINTCMLLVSGLWLCKHSRQLHSPSLVAIGRSVGYETWPPILYWMALHFCNWLSLNMDWDCVQLNCIMSSCTQWEFPLFFRFQWQSPCTAAIRAVQGDCERV